VRLTSEDFGFDLGAWQAYLETHRDHGYTHPYGVAQTRKLVAAALADPGRRRLVALLEADPPPAPRKPSRREVEARAARVSQVEAHFKGLMEGLASGRRGGRADALLKQLEARFGALPAATEINIRSAPDAQISRWLIRVLTEPSLEAVLGVRRKAPETPAPKRTKRRAAARR
jgi:hypothetical protein